MIGKPHNAEHGASPSRNNYYEASVLKQCDIAQEWTDRPVEENRKYRNRPNYIHKCRM